MNTLEPPVIPVPTTPPPAPVLTTEEKRVFIVNYYTETSPSRANEFLAPLKYDKVYSLPSPSTVDTIAQVLREHSLTDANPTVFLDENGGLRLRALEKETKEEFDKRVDITYNTVVLEAEAKRTARLVELENLIKSYNNVTLDNRGNNYMFPNGARLFVKVVTNVEEAYTNYGGLVGNNVLVNTGMKSDVELCQWACSRARYTGKGYQPAFIAYYF